MNNSLARSISNAGLKIQYDALCRQVLSHRNILAWILKYTTEEFKNYSIVITLNEAVATENAFLQMMNTLLSKTKSYEEKKEKLENKFHIPMSRGAIGEELRSMCNLSDLVEEQGIQKGIQIGKQQQRRKTQRERKRADAAEQRAIRAELEVERLKKELQLLKAN